MQIKKLISGGQTGADMGGLMGARRAGVATGGLIPKGWRTEIGSQPELQKYGLTEHTSSEYAPRTIDNVKNADITLIFATDVDSDGTRATINAARVYHKPYLCVDPFDDSSRQQVIVFIKQHHPGVINIAGNRESVSPGIGQRVAMLIEGVLMQLN